MKTKYSKSETALFTVSLLQCGYLMFIQCVHVYNIDLYRYAITGAVYEMFTLPVFLSVFVATAFYVVVLIKNLKAISNWKTLLGIIINLGMVIFLLKSFL
ncbi:MAG: hypothetical protein WBG46_10660 [Nonlabens sp.]